MTTIKYLSIESWYGSREKYTLVKINKKILVWWIWWDANLTADATVLMSKTFKSFHVIAVTFSYYAYLLKCSVISRNNWGKLGCLTRNNWK